MTPELLVNEHCSTGENPLWDAARGLLYWCDIPAGKIFALDLKTGQHKTIYHDAECGAFVLQADGSLLLLRTGDAVRLDPDSGEITSLKTSLVQNTGRFNDCIADPQGRVFSGTVDWSGAMKGALFQLDTDWNVTKIYEGTACSNGMAFAPDLKGLYWSDTTAKTVYLFDYDAETGQLSNRRPWLETPGLSNDGLTIDTNGNLWIAYYDGGFLRHYDARANLLTEVDIPAKNVTACIFGGENLEELFVTTAGGKEGSDTLDGALFRLRPEVGGRPEYPSRLGL